MDHYPFNLRRAVCDLGSSNPDRRARARATLLEAGELAAALLLGAVQEAEAKRAARKPLMRILAPALVTAILLLSLLVTHRMPKGTMGPPLMIWVNMIGGIVFVRMDRARRWQREAVALLAELPGNDALPVLIREMQDWRRERQAATKRTALIGSVVFVGLYLLLRYLEDTTAASKLYFMYIVCTVAGSYLLRPPRWYHKAAELLDHFDGSEATRAMLEAYWVGDRSSEELRSAIIHRLDRITAGDAAWLTGEYRAQIVRWPPFDGNVGRRTVDEKLAIVRAAEHLLHPASTSPGSTPDALLRSVTHE